MIPAVYHKIFIVSVSHLLSIVAKAQSIVQ